MGRILSFNVDGQNITKDPTCDFTGLVPGTAGYVTAEFAFSKDWDDCIKVVGFKSGGNEYDPKILKDGRSCMIDEEVLNRSMFYIYVVGKKRDFRIKTNDVLIKQDGGMR